MADCEHLLSPENQYLSNDDLMLKFGLPPKKENFCSYIKLVAKLPKQ